MSNDDAGKSPRPLGGARKPSKDEDNPFMRQLQLMLDKSDNNRTASISPSSSHSPSLSLRATNTSSTGAWRPTGISDSGGGSGGDGCRPRGARGWVGEAGGSFASQIGRSTARPFTISPNGADRDKNLEPRLRSPPVRSPPARTRPSSLLDLLDTSSSSSSSSDEGDGKFRRGTTFGTTSSKMSLSVAEAKASPSPDGGWPETKRCSPPNLKATLSSRGHADSGDGGTHGPVVGGIGSGGGSGRGSGCDGGSRRGSKGNTVGAGRSSGVTEGDEEYCGAGITGLLSTARISDVGHLGSTVAGGGRIYGGSPQTPSGTPCGRSAPARPMAEGAAAASAIAASSDSEWMSDAEDPYLPAYISSSYSAAVTTAAEVAAEAARKTVPGGLKRGRTSPATHCRSPSSPSQSGGGGGGGGGRAGYGSDSSSGGDGGSGDGRARKTRRRSGSYPSPATVRRQRRNSLSLSPTRLPPRDGDYVTSEEEGASTHTVQGGRARPRGRKGKGSGSRTRGGGGNNGGSLSSSATAVGRVVGDRCSETGDGSAGGSADGYGRKRRHDELLNDRIQAMRVDSDGEGGAGERGTGKSGKRRGRADPLGEEREEEEEEEEDDEIDGEDRKPRFEDPPWLGKLEPLDLGGGDFINPSINRYLRDYQREGVRWLHTKFKAGKGGILGDDMGLGKTVQSITLLSAVLQKTGTRRDNEELRRRRKAGLPVSATGLPWLIVAPASVVRVWIDHLKRWGYFSAFQLESRKDVDDLMVALSAGRYEVVATSYDLLRACVDQLKKQRFDAVLFDEYHTIKSSTARVSQAACELKTKRVFGLTGTLIQNDMKELWFLLHLIDPLATGEQSRFTEHFSEPIKRARAKNANAFDRKLGEKRLKELDAIREKTMIRRTKEMELGDVLKGKTDTVVFCDLSEVQRDLYKRVLSLPEFQLLLRAKEPCDCGRTGRPTRAKCCYKVPYGDCVDGIDPRAVLFRKYHPSLVECDKCPFCSQLVAVSKLSKIANHPCLLQENVRDSEEARRHQRQFAQVAFSERAKEIMGGLERSQKFLDVAKVDVCGKMKSLEALLGIFHKGGEKVLVFSLSTAMLDVLENFVGSKGYVYRRLDGSTSPKERQARIDEFNSDRRGVFVFLISTRAGGQGLNLHTASKVILYDVNWNPALELQAQDRAYRIGQKKKVAVFRLVSKGTIEEVCYMRQIYKLQITSAAMGDQARGGRRQFNAVQGSKGQEGELFGIQNLLKFSDDSLLKALRMKHEAGRASSAAAVEDSAANGSNSTGGGGGGGAGGGTGDGNLAAAGVEAADEADLVLAVKDALDRAKEEIKGGGAEGPPGDNELADLLGMLGVDAYTHDQLVAKDEGEEELVEEESCSAMGDLPSVTPLPNGGARNTMEETIVKSRPETGGTVGSSRPPLRLVVGGRGRGGLHPSARRERIGAASTFSGGGGRSRDFGGGGNARRDGGSNGSVPRTASAESSRKVVVDISGEEDGSERKKQKKQQRQKPPTLGLQQRPEPPVKRRNLDWCKGGRWAVGARGGGGRGAAAGTMRIELFMPQYGSNSNSKYEGSPN